MINGQKMLRMCAAISWVICLVYLSTIVQRADYPLLATGGLLLGAVLWAIAEIRPLPVEVRAGAFMSLLVLYNFVMAYHEGMVISAPFVLLLITVATSVFLNQRLLFFVCAFWNAVFLGFIAAFPAYAFKVFDPMEYIYIFALMEGGWLYASLFIRFVTAQMRSAEQLTEAAQRAYRTKGEFLANMSHEIRTPMNAIVGMSELILHATADTPIREIRQNALQIKGAGMNLIGLIDEVMEIAKIEQSQVELHEAVYGLRSMLYDVIELMNIRLDGRPVLLLTDLNISAAPELWGDEHRIKQVLFNVLGNAVKYTRQGHILFTVKQAPLAEDRIMLTLQVADTGIGMREEDMAKLFQQFQQMDRVKNRQVEGTGLGLAITRRLVAAMGGDIGVSSKYGEGTTFTINIPQRLPKQRGHALPAQRQSKRFRVHNARVLLVDDNQVNLTVTTELFKLYGISPDAALSGREALSRIAKHHYDIIYMDHMMPEMDGIETTKAIRALPISWCWRVPIVALTANAVAGMKQVFLESGMDDFLAKPLLLPDLEQTLRRYLPAQYIEDIEDEPDAPPDVIDEPELFIDGVDVETGIGHCGGTRAAYMEVLRSLRFNAPAQMQTMRDALKAGDIARVALEVHALKSAARGIGAMALGELAYEMEMRGKADDEAYVADHLPALLDHYAALVSAVEAAMAPLEAPEHKGDMDGAERVASLRALLAAAESYDLDGAQTELNRLLSCAHPDGVQASLESIQAAVLTYSYDAVTAETQALIEQMEVPNAQ